MKRKIKRKLFVMGMLVAAGMPVASWSKEAAAMNPAPASREAAPGSPAVAADKTRLATGAEANRARADVQQANETEDVLARPAQLLVSLAQLLVQEKQARLRDRDSEPAKSWRLQMLPNDRLPALDPHPKIGADARVGFGLSLDF